MANNGTKRVLVRLGRNNRPVTLEPGDSSTDVERLRKTISLSFRDILKADASDSGMILQIKSEDWGGKFVDIEPNSTIPDKSVVRVLQPESLNLGGVTERVAEEVPGPSQQSSKAVYTPLLSDTLYLRSTSRQSTISVSPAGITLEDPVKHMQGEINETQREYIRKQTKVYGKDPTKKLTPWHEKVNNAAYELALSNPNMLLLPKQELIEAAQKKVRNQGYNFVKGKSRSKHIHNPDMGELPSPAPKRPKVNEAMRNKKIAELQEDVKDLKDRLSYKEKQRDQATQAMNYKLCDQLTEEMCDVKRQLRKVENQLEEWTKKDKKSQWYFKAKKQRKSSSSTSVGSPGGSESDSSSALPLSSPGSDAVSSRNSALDYSPSPVTPVTVPTTPLQSETTSQNSSCDHSPSPVTSSTVPTTPTQSGTTSANPICCFKDINSIDPHHTPYSFYFCCKLANTKTSFTSS